jgi:hypothetical protein
MVLFFKESFLNKKGKKITGKAEGTAFSKTSKRRKCD